MYRRLGRFPTESSEHSAEYVGWYLPHPEQVERFRLVPAEYVGISEENLAEYHRTAEAVRRGSPITFGTEAVEYAPQVIHALATGTTHDIYATVRNRGWIDNLPDGAAVEVPVTVDADGAHPQAVGALPEVCSALNRRFLDVVGLTIEAAVSGDPELVRRAALLDPNTSASLTPDQIDVVLTELSKVHASTLPAGLADHDYASPQLSQQPREPVHEEMTMRTRPWIRRAAAATALLTGIATLGACGESSPDGPSTDVREG